MALEAIEQAIANDRLESYEVEDAHEQLSDLRALLSALESEKPFLGGKAGRLLRKITGPGKQEEKRG